MNKRAASIAVYLALAVVALAIGFGAGIGFFQIMGGVFVALTLVSWWVPYLNGKR